MTTSEVEHSVPTPDFVGAWRAAVLRRQRQFGSIAVWSSVGLLVVSIGLGSFLEGRVAEAMFPVAVASVLALSFLHAAPYIAFAPVMWCEWLRRQPAVRPETATEQIFVVTMRWLGAFVVFVGAGLFSLDISHTFSSEQEAADRFREMLANYGGATLVIFAFGVLPWHLWKIHQRAVTKELFPFDDVRRRTVLGLTIVVAFTTMAILSYLTAPLVLR